MVGRKTRIQTKKQKNAAQDLGLHFFLLQESILANIYQQGSLGASGDLAPLAHLSLPLIGEGEVEFENTRYSGEAINKKFNLAPITLHPKEGLALLNGTQFMSAYATFAIHKSYDLWNKWNHIAALSLEGFNAKIDPFNPGVHALRHQVGQIETAKIVRELLAGSQLIKQPKIHVQDPYSFRCIPQVHGATKDTIDHCSSIVEMNYARGYTKTSIFPTRVEKKIFGVRQNFPTY